MTQRKKRYGNGHTLHDFQRKRAFGLEPQANWPREGMSERYIVTDGLRILHKVLPVGQELNATAYRGRRCVAQCDSCGKWVCAGHFGQHRKVHI